MWLLILQRLAFETVIDIVSFPLWWYTEGARRSLGFCVRVFQIGNGDLAPILWLKNLFVPMYGLYDWQGRLMSFFVRLANFFIRAFGLFIWFLVSTVLFLLWLLLPLFFFVLLVRTLL